MAKIKFGAIVTDIRGSIDSVTYSRSRYGAYARKKVTPVNPATVAQSAARAIFGAASSLFRSLGSSVVDAWNAVAPEYSRANIFGDNLPLSGSTLFTKLKTQLMVAGITTDPDAISPVTVPVLEAGALDADKSDNSIELSSVPATNANQVIVAYATAPYSPGKTFVPRSAFRLVAVRPVSTATGSFDLSAEYITVFGNAIANAAVGQKVTVAAKFVDTRNGQAGPEKRYTTEIIA